MFTRYPILTRFIVFIFAPLAILLVFILVNLNQSLPQVSGRLSIEGITQSVKLNRDQNGVVHIEAKTDNDAYFALGFAHAQDRLWQLEVQKRTVQGRLSEVFGKEAVSADIWFRTLGLYRSGAKSWHVLSTKAQSALSSYTAGINAYIAQNKDLPAEFLFLDIKPEPWHVNDSLAYIKLFALNLSGDFRIEIQRLLASSKLDEQQMATVFQDYPKDAPVTVAKLAGLWQPQQQIKPQTQQGLEQLLQLQQSLESNFKIGGRFAGSNAWVVSAKHTQNQQTLLANDPHLGLQIPSLWYAATMRGDKLDSAGMTLVGLPMIIFGRNRNISWGGTSMMIDNQDLYFERVNENNTTSYYDNGQWFEFEVIDETLNVRADFPSSLRKALAPIDIKIRHTKRGPVISDVFKVFEQPVSMSWTALKENDTTFDAFFKLNYATNWDEFQNALSNQVAPALNMFYADTKGNIGYLGAGDIPIRNKSTGALPAPGWDSNFGWSGVVPANQWPKIYNPESGYIVNANNKVVDDDYPYFISRGFAPPARANRIIERLTDKIDQSKPLSIADMGDIQADMVDLSVQDLLPILQKVKADGEQQQQVIAALDGFNGEMSASSSAATIYTQWMRFLRQGVFADELSEQWGRFEHQGFANSVSGSVTAKTLKQVLTDNNSIWCDDINTEQVEDCAVILQTSLQDTIKRLTKLRGDDISDWQWGDINQTEYDHQPFSQFKLLDKIFERRISNGGSSNSINVSVASYEPSEGYLTNFGAGFRQIIALSEQNQAHLFMNSTGQSGNVLSPHYDDMVTPFRDVDFVSMQAGQSTALILDPPNKEPKQ